MCRRHGFTLIELLVVVATIVLLGAVMYPVLINAQHKGQQAVCLSNTKQIALATILYADDHSGALPPIWTAKPNDPWDPYGYGTKWYHRIWPYMRGNANKKILACPGSRARAQFCNYSCNPSMAFSYGANGTLVPAPWRMSDIRFPSRRAFVGDGVPHWMDGQVGSSRSEGEPARGDAEPMFRYWSGYPVNDYLMDTADQCDSPRLYSGQVDYRHNGGANFSMLDGHSKWITRGGLQEYNWWSPREMPGFAYIGENGGNP